MVLQYLTPEAVKSFITSALAEDIGDGDHSALSAIPADTISKAQMIIKGEGLIAGLELARQIFAVVDPALQVKALATDGEHVKYGDIVLQVHGSARSILGAERLVLNCVQRMSGIATYTNHLTKLIAGTTATLLDTRKTTPNFRLPEKWAVFIGGGKNHRFGLYDMIMLKDNHIDFAGGVGAAIYAAQAYLDKHQKNLKIEVETRTLEEVQQVLDAGGVDVIMLDNMAPALLKDAVSLIGGQFKTEASGGITESTIREVAETGVDYISVGALTHSVKSLDISLKAF